MQTKDKNKKTKKGRTLRRSLIILMLLAVALPMLCLAMISQYRIWKISEAYMNEIIASDIQALNTSLDMVLDKYATVLYDFCIDEDVIQLVESMERNKGQLDTNHNRLRRKLTYICERNEGIEGITLITSSGQVIFYDRMTDSSEVSTWVGQVKVPDFHSDVVYQDVEAPIQTEEGEIRLYQVARNVMDYRNVGREIGTVVLSINTDTLSDVINTGKNDDTYICRNGRILSSAKPNCPIKDISAVSKKDQRVTSITNERSGWTIYKYYSMVEYSEALRNQTIMLIFTAISMALFLIGAIWYITKPMLVKVEGLVHAMSQVERGDFTVQVSTSGRIPIEVRWILDMFNNMVRQLYKLIDQVKQSAIDQKNAEISAMEAQIDPHFLYNTLDTINWKALEKKEYEISSMVGALADILRYSIRNPGETVSIGQALYWMEQYTMLQSKKLEAPLELVQNVSEEIKNYRIHKLLIQPFVENAIRHGFYQKKDVCRLEVSISMAMDQLHIIVKDNGRGIPPEELARLNDESADMTGHVGLNNARKRMQLYYGQDATVYFESKEGCYTKVHIFVDAFCREEENM